LGGIGALAATVIGRADPVRAGVDGDVVLGGSNTTTTATRITNTQNDFDAFSATASGIGTGITGTGSPGVCGPSTSGPGVQGNSSSGNGVAGSSASSHGVFAGSSSATQAAILGWATANNTGVQGYSGAASPTASKADTGVYGYAAHGAGSHGVWGESPTGIGVVGSTTSGYAGYFIGKLFASSFMEMSETTTAPAPVANRARLFVRDNGSGKTQLCVRFHTGAVAVLATEP
jgi:hypothetical protein